MIPTKEEFIKGIKEYEKREKRDAMYKVALFIINHFLDKKDLEMVTNGLGVLLLTWNQAFYRYGEFDFDKLERCIKNNFEIIIEFRKRRIESLSSNDEFHIKTLFNELLNALSISRGKRKGRKSPVAVAKALHLLAPNFFPLWDEKISRGYHCFYDKDPAEKYTRFMYIMKEFVRKVKELYLDSDVETLKSKGILKLIDEYNYSKYTKGWI